MATLDLINRYGAANVSAEDVCREAGVPVGSFQHITGRSWTRYMLELLNAGNYGPPKPLTKSRTDPLVMAAHLVTVALDQAATVGYKHLTRGAVAKAAGVHPATVYRVFPTTEHMDRAVMQAARDRNVPRVLAQGLAHGDPIATRASDDQKQAAAEWMGL